MENEWTKMGWGVLETGEGSNTAITTQLISIDVTERISVTPSMFIQPGSDPPLKKGKKGGKQRVDNSTSPSIHSFRH